MSGTANDTELQQLLHDSTRAEHLLLQRASQPLHGAEQAALRKQAAIQLIALLRSRAERLGNEQGRHTITDEASGTLDQPAEADTAIEAEQELLRFVFSQQVLAELCSILHNLYFRQTQLQAQKPIDSGKGRQQAPSTHPASPGALQPVNLHATQLSVSPAEHAQPAKSCSISVQTEADLQPSDELSHLRYVSTLQHIC